MRGSKPRTNIIPIDPHHRGSAAKPPAWLTSGARREWDRCAADLAKRGILFDGALSSLAIYCALIDQIQQLAKTVAEEGPVGPAQRAMLSTSAQARMLAAELGLSVVSRTRSFQGKAADEREWDELEVG